MPHDQTSPARVVVIAGPSGSGKSRLTRRLGLPALNLDDFYKDGDDPTLPVLDLPGGEPVVDWDSAQSWNAPAAVATIEKLCTEGSARVPVYDISQSRTTGARTLTLGGSPVLVAEGIFAPEIVAECERLGLLADAVCVTQHPAVTFLRRLTRDLRERRKSPVYLLRRGFHLAREQQRVVARAAELGCRVEHPNTAYAALVRLASPVPPR